MTVWHFQMPKNDKSGVFQISLAKDMKALADQISDRLLFLLFLTFPLMAYHFNKKESPENC